MQSAAFDDIEGFLNNHGVNSSDDRTCDSKEDTDTRNTSSVEEDTDKEAKGHKAACKKYEE